MTTLRRFFVIVTMTVLPMLGAGLAHTTPDDACMIKGVGMFNPCAELDTTMIEDWR